MKLDLNFENSPVVLSLFNLFRWELYDVDFSQSLQTLWAVTLIFLTCVRKSLLPGKYADLPGGWTPPEGCELFADF